MKASDTALLERWVAQRDAEAFATLVSRHSSMVYAVCRRILRNRADAEEVAQECFVNLLSHGPARVADAASLGEWLHTVATRRAIDRLRSDTQRRVREERFASGTAQAQDARKHDESHWDEVQGYLDEAIAGLPEKLRYPIVVHFLEGQSHRAIAQALELPRTTVTSRIAKGIDEVRGALKRLGVPVSSSALASLLTVEAAEMAPPALTASLGKVALTAGHGVAGTVAATHTPSMLATLGTLGGFVMNAKKIGLGLAVLAACLGGLYLFSSETPVEAPNEAAPVVQTADGGGALPTTSDGASAKPGADSYVGDGTVAGTETESGVEGIEEDTMQAAPAGADGNETSETPSTPTGVVRGRVYDGDSGAGIPDILVVALRTSMDAELPGPNVLDQRSDAAGNYSIELPAPARYLIQARETGDYAYSFFRGDSHKLEFEVEVDQHLDGVDIGLVLGGSISGKIYVGDGETLAGADVYLLDMQSGSNMARDTTRSGEDGTYVFRGLTKGKNMVVRASHEGFAATDSETILVYGAHPNTDVDIHLGLGNTLYGRVVNSEGQGLPEVYVQLLGADEGNYAPVPFLNATTDRDGAFSIESVAANAYRPQVRCGVNSGGIFTNRTGPRFTMPADSDLDDLVIVADIEGYITGKVTDSKGNSLPAMMVGAHAPNVHGWSVTESDGVYRIEGLGGSELWAMQLFERAGYPQIIRRDVPINSDGVDFVRTKAGSVSGRVIDGENGEPVPRFEIKAHGVWAAWREYVAETGEFVVGDIGAEEVVLEIRAQGYPSVTTEAIEVPPGETVAGIEVSLFPGEEVSGWVLAAGTHEPIQGARVGSFDRLLNAQQLTSGVLWGALSPVTGPEGQFVLTGIEPGEPVDLVAWRQGHAPAVILDSMEGEVTFLLDRGATITGTVYDGDRPLPTKRVTCMRNGATDGSKDGFRYQAMASATPEGAFEITNLPAGAYRLTCFGPEGTVLWNELVELEENETVELSMQAADAAAIDGQVTGPLPEGDRLAMALLDPARNWVATARCDDQGRFRFQGIVPGDYIIHVFQGRAQGILAEGQVTLGAGETLALSLELGAGL